MGSIISKDDQTENYNPLISYNPCKMSFFDPNVFILNFLLKQDLIKDTIDEDIKLKIIYKEKEYTIVGFLPIIKYIGRTNYLYPKNDLYNCSLIDYWIDRYIRLDTMFKAYKQQTIYAGSYFSFLEEEFRFFSQCCFEYRFIENFRRPTIADFCWYSFFLFCINSIDHSSLINDYSTIIKYTKNMELQFPVNY